MQTSFVKVELNPRKSKCTSTYVYLNMNQCLLIFTQVTFSKRKKMMSEKLCILLFILSCVDS